MSDWTFLVSGLGIPIALTGANILVRAFLDAKPTASADVILAVAAFDALVISEHGKFEKPIENEIFRTELISIYLVLLILNFAVWIFAVHIIERKIEPEYRAWMPQRTVSLGWKATSVMLPSSSACLSLLPLAFKG